VKEKAGYHKSGAGHPSFAVHHYHILEAFFEPCMGRLTKRCHKLQRRAIATLKRKACHLHGKKTLNTKVNSMNIEKIHAHYSLQTSQYSFRR